MSEEEICEILESPLIQLNGANTAYGGGISSFSLTMGGISSQTKGSITLVGPNLTIPSVADDLEIKVMGLNLNMQVGGYNLQSSAASAGQLQLSLYDNSNWYLDHNHIALKEEAPVDSKASNIHILGRKVGTIPNKTLNKYGIRTGNVDTMWGDVRDFYEAFTPFWAGGADGWAATVDAYVRSNAGKTIWHVKENDDWDDKTLAEAFGDILAEGSELVEGQFDFKGSFRDVISSYCSATSLQAWWDLEDDVLIIKRTKSEADGMEKLDKIKEKCRVLSSAESKDWTSTFTKGAMGSITSSFQGENQQSGGYSVSRYFRAHLLNPTFHYKACRDKNWDRVVNKFTAIDFESTEVLQAMQASANDTIWGAYVCQSMLSFTPVPDPQVPSKTFNGALDVENITTTLRTNAKAQTKTTVNGDEDVAAGEDLLETDLVWTEQFTNDPATFGRYNSFIKNYYWADNVAADTADPTQKNFTEATCPARLVPVSTDDEITKQIMQLANKEAANGKQKNTGWNNQDDSFPKSKCGAFDEGLGEFGSGQLFLLQNLWFDSILGDTSLNAQNDLLKAYLNALYGFYQKFYVVKDTSTLVSAGIKDSRGNNVDYGYYLTSEDAVSNQVPQSEGDLAIVALNPLLGLGECECSQIKDLAVACAAMYLPKNTDYSDFVEQVAVIDFIYALEQGGQNLPKGQPTSLMKFFENVGAVAMATPVRAVDAEDEDAPQLTMYLVERQDERTPLGEAFLTEEEGMVGQNRNVIIQGDSTVNLLEDACKDIIQKLPLNGNAILSQIFGKGDVEVKEVWKSWKDLEDADELYAQKPVELWVMGVPTRGGGGIDLTREIGLATLPEADKDTIKLWYAVSGTTNAIGSEPNEWTISAITAPKPNSSYDYWSSKMDYGVSLNAADVGMTNTEYSTWEASAGDAGNLYSSSNRKGMGRALTNKVAEAAFSVSIPGKSTNLSVILDKYDVELDPDLDLTGGELEAAEADLLELPKMDEGLEALQISVSGGKTTLSLTVGNSLQKVAMKNIYDRMVQSPSSMYRPGSVIQESLLDTTPTFQIRQRGMAS